MLADVLRAPVDFEKVQAGPVRKLLQRCSGLRYAAVPRMTPAYVACTDSVGEFIAHRGLRPDARRRCRRLGEAEVEDLHRAVGAHFDVRGLEIAMDEPLLVCGFERLGNLFRDRQRLVDRNDGECVGALRGASARAAGIRTPSIDTFV